MTVEDRAAEMGDTVTFDFEGRVDGEPFEGGKAENYTLSPRLRAVHPRF